MWLSQFLLGRPGVEYTFDVNPAAMSINEVGVIVVKRNLAGDLKKSVLKTSAPVIQINSSFLTLSQRNKIASLVGIADTMLSFQTRDDWQVIDELVTVIDSTHLKISNSSASKLSAALVANGFSSQITFVTPFKLSIGGGQNYGSGLYGYGGYGGISETFDPGAITYADATRIITMTNPLSDVTQPVFVTYTYKGWLVNLESFDHSIEGGWVDRFKYGFKLMGA